MRLLNPQDVLVTPEHGVMLEGTLRIPDAATGVVVFAHGSGSSRHSPRNRYVAQVLYDRGLGTLLFDLLTSREEAEDMFDGHLRFDIPLLARRVQGATDWLWNYLAESPAVSDASSALASHPKIGYFGSSTGAAAALVAASRAEHEIGAIVSRGGRPDLAGDDLAAVNTPTLLIVGGNDTLVIELNEQARDLMHSPAEIRIVPGAGHLFEEPGALEEVAEIAAEWFVRHLRRP